MEENLQSAEAIKDIRRMMDRSSRFISLSGLSGISAGICALIGAWIAYGYIYGTKPVFINDEIPVEQLIDRSYKIYLNTYLFWIAIGTLTGALVTAFFFTWIKSKKEGITMWGSVSKRLMISVCIPMLAGGIFLFRILEEHTNIGFIAPGCLIFYGLALINASKYTLGEIKYLGYCQVLLGIINLWFIGCGLYFWATGFGVLHIAYGIYMWQKYDRIK